LDFNGKRLYKEVNEMAEPLALLNKHKYKKDFGHSVTTADKARMLY
jgi:hypothetical protein